MTIHILAAFLSLAPVEPLPDAFEAGWEGEAVCEVLRDDAALRIARCTFAPGKGHERHSHRPHFGYVLSDSRMQTTDARGARVNDLKAGSSWSSEGIEWHEALNVGDTPGIFLIIEPKAKILTTPEG